MEPRNYAGMQAACDQVLTKASEYDQAANRWARVKEQLNAARTNAQRAADELAQIEKEEAAAWSQLEMVAGRAQPQCGNSANGLGFIPSGGIRFGQ